MINKSSPIAVASRSFTKSKELRKRLEQNFDSVKYNEDLLHFDEESLITFLHGSEAAIVSEDKISKKVIDGLPDLKVVSKFGVGLDGIDLDYLKEKEVILGWNSGVNSSSVAELALAYIILLLREAYQLNREMLNYKWKKVINSRDLSGTTVGIIGFGHIGRKLTDYLGNFKTEVLIYDPLIDSNEKIPNFSKFTSFEFLLKNSDAISIHIPLLESTKGLIGQNELSMMKDGSVLINLARGGIVDELYLYEALKTKRLAGAAFDVFEIEPINTDKFNSRLLKLSNFFATPHIAGTSNQSTLRMGNSAIDCLINERR